MIPTQNEVRDTVILTEVIKDTVVTVAPDSSLVQALIECDSLGRASIAEVKRLRAGRVLKPPELKINDNIITVESKIDSLDIYLTYKERYKEEVKSSNKVYIQEVNILTAWQKLLITMGRILCGLLLLTVGYLIYNLIKR